jgi:chromosome segregation protein
VFLRSLTLRGFKSFAEKTELTFEPGITVIVGPNGSGKSNVVDALTWVLGSHSAKTLRGGSMSDVIFAGARGRPGLGRAAVDITIDNTSGTLPIEFSEVTVSRSMFATGENDYAINSVACRLLDVQELLSDTGLGRENHTIVGQGQLDRILNSRPEDRRAFIEEAAGILKHRRRKERAVRKLAQMDAHVERLTDVLRELRRNLRPLERQAEAATKHAELQAQLREVRTIRALRTLDELTTRWDADQAGVAQSDTQLQQLEARLRAARASEAAIEQVLADLEPEAEQVGQTHFRLANQTERFRGLSERIEERRRGLLEAVEEPVAGHDPVELRVQAEADEEAAARVEGERQTVRDVLKSAAAARQLAEQRRRAHEQAAVAEARRRTEVRERRLRWEAEVSALRSTLAQAAAEAGRLASQVSGSAARRGELTTDRDSLQAQIQRLDARAVALAERLAAAEQALEGRRRDADAAVSRERDLERRRASLEARAEALRTASGEATEGSSALLAAARSGAVGGVAGPLAEHVRVADGLAKAVAAGLGPLGDALIVDSPAAATAAIGFVRRKRYGRALLLIDAGPDGGQPATAPDLSSLGATPLVEALDAEPGVLAALARGLQGVYFTEAVATAAQLAQRFPELAFVSRDGEVAGPRGWSGGSATVASAVLSRAAAEQAEVQLAEVAGELLEARGAVGEAERHLAAAQRSFDAAAEALQESDSLITSAAERLRRLGKELQTCERELAMLTGQQADLEHEVAARHQRLAALEVMEESLQDGAPAPSAVDAAPVRPDVAAPVEEEPGADLEAERLDDELTAAREREVQARLAAAAVDQRAEELGRRIGALQREADEIELALTQRDERRRRRVAAIERCGKLAALAEAALARAESSSLQAAQQRQLVGQARDEQQRRLGVVRMSIRDRDEEVAAVREQRHFEDLARQALRHDLEAATSRLRHDLGVDPDAALRQARATLEDGPLAEGEHRAEQLAQDEERLVRKVGLLGMINPLALEEFQQSEERHRFLTTQLEDLRASKRDLLTVIEAVDERIRELFAVAFSDVAAHFERIFPRLFPGGEGRLVLTDPDDQLASGVDVEARPAGKRVKRLSLLSGGERSLTALAVLFSIFAARPSPFYVLDEVEAALDDVNLQRLLDLVTDFRSTSQVIIITHQQRTMEIADCLYGVTMRADGVSAVVSQRLTEAVPAAR